MVSQVYPVHFTQGISKVDPHASCWAHFSECSEAVSHQKLQSKNEENAAKICEFQFDTLESLLRSSGCALQIALTISDRPPQTSFERRFSKSLPIATQVLLAHIHWK